MRLSAWRAFASAALSNPLLPPLQLPTLLQLLLPTLLRLQLLVLLGRLLLPLLLRMLLLTFRLRCCARLLRSISLPWTTSPRRGCAGKLVHRRQGIALFFVRPPVSTGGC